MQRGPFERYEGISNKGMEETANKELYNLNCSPDFVRVINLERGPLMVAQWLR
jgi:hypothetical protein